VKRLLYTVQTAKEVFDKVGIWCICV